MNFVFLLCGGALQALSPSASCHGHVCRISNVGTCGRACSLGRGCELVSRFPTTLDAESKRSPSLTLHVVLDSSLHFRTHVANSMMVLSPGRACPGAWRIKRVTQHPSPAPHLGVSGPRGSRTSGVVCVLSEGEGCLEERAMSGEIAERGLHLSEED